jgi:hypothetical protein
MKWPHQKHSVRRANKGRDNVAAKNGDNRAGGKQARRGDCPGFSTEN